MTNVLQFPIKKASTLLSRAQALEHFNRSDLWFFVDLHDYHPKMFGNKRIALFVPRGQKLPEGLLESDFGRVYFEGDSV